jgi:ribosomal protein S18 acetylase RimI-like enzyme
MQVTEQLRWVEDTWLGARLRKPAFHVVGDLTQLVYLEDDLSLRLAKGPLFVDMKVPVNDITPLPIIQRLGFSLIDTQISFCLMGGRPNTNASADISFAQPHMAESIGKIAAQFLVHDRFHRDPAIPAAAALVIKRDWARNFFAGLRGDWMVVASRQGLIVGFLQLLRSERGELVIDLIAVHADHRRQGIARAMIHFALNHCGTSGPMIVGTQAANVPSIQLYESIGFRFQKAQYVYHYHGSHAR